MPFCLRGGLTRTTGVGEKMADLPCSACWPLVVVQPCEGLSTKEIFTAYHEGVVERRPDNLSAADALAAGDPDALQAAMANVMQPVSTRRRPEIARAIAALRDCGAFAAQMTGSGSAVIGAFRTAAEADKAFTAISGLWEKTFRCDTCMKGLVIDED
ncbi:MAG: hypothetical protein IJ343_00195 [Clostridia bacterium]|nr:hypothetical protein [Clostridia bacterium]